MAQIFIISHKVQKCKDKRCCEEEETCSIDSYPWRCKIVPWKAFILSFWVLVFIKCWYKNLLNLIKKSGLVAKVEASYIAQCWHQCWTRFQGEHCSVLCKTTDNTVVPFLAFSTMDHMAPSRSPGYFEEATGENTNIGCHSTKRVGHREVRIERATR